MSAVDPSRVPKTLQDREQWIVWRNMLRGQSWTKVPYQVDGDPASSTDPATWTTFQRAMNAYGVGARVYSGIGFVFSRDDDFCGVDLDGCRDPKTGKIEEWARRWLVEFDSYAEVSPSETGIKIWLLGKKPEWSGSKVQIADAPPIGDHAPAVECYDWGRYFAVTGQRLAGLPEEPQERQDVLDRFVDEYWKAPEVARPTENIDFGSETAIVERARRYLAKLPEAVSGQGGHNATFRAACVLAKGFGLAREHVAELLTEWNQSHCKPSWSEKELRHKVDQAMKAPGEVNYLRHARPHDWGRIDVPAYSEPALAAAAPPAGPSITTTTLEEAAYLHLETLMGGGAGLIKLGLPEVDNALGGGVAAGEMAVIGARPSHGKSAVALQVSHHFTATVGPAVFISEEMSAFALGQRTIQYASDVPGYRWQKDSKAVVSQLADHFEHRDKCYVVEGCGTARRAADQIRQHVDKFGCKLAVVDYAQFLRGEGANRYDQVANVSTTMKTVAKETGVVLLLLCQLNREVEKRKTYVPLMSDLREAGQLEQDADVILLLVWPWKVDSRQEREKYQFFIAKNRNREIVKPAVTCRFDSSRQMLLAGPAPGSDGPYDFGDFN